MTRPLLLFGLVSLAAASTPAAPPLRVACVGDSITYGDKLDDRATQSYPAVLQRLSQGRFTVDNFGVNSATALSGIPFRSWIDTPACPAALASSPDLVVIMLGINDRAYPNLHARYSADLRALVQRFQALPSAPRLFLCTLTPIAPEEHQTSANRTIRDTMNPAIRTVAAETGATLIDLSAVYPNRLELLPDGLHPSPAGAELIARTILAVLESTPTPTPKIQSAPATGPVDISIRNEAYAAQDRANRWLQTQPAPSHLPSPSALFDSFDLRSPEDVTELLPLLSGPPSPTKSNPFFYFAALAYALDRIGHETVFLPNGSPVSWREALLHQVIQSQQMDARGGGFWSPPATDESPADAVSSTLYALQAIASALNE